MRPQKFTPRADYRQKENQRVEASACLSEKFQEMKALTVELSYFSPEGVSRNSQITYTVNPDRAKSVFRFDCLNHECVRGDFDMSDALTQAVAKRRTSASGEMCCQGWLNKTTIDKVRCRQILRYKLTLAYAKRSPRAAQLQAA